LTAVTARIQVPREARRGDLIEVRIIIQHPMETGFRYDSLGRQTPRNVIYSFECRYGGAQVFRASLSAGIAANPYLRFFTRADKSGDIECRWIDQENVSGSVSARVTVTA
jgi:sulfur-oxidizing protein SoxZ